MRHTKIDENTIPTEESVQCAYFIIKLSFLMKKKSPSKFLAASFFYMDKFVNNVEPTPNLH